MAEESADLPPDVLNELITRIDALEKEQAENKEFRTAVESAVRAFLVVFGIWRLPDQPRHTPHAP